MPGLYGRAERGARGVTVYLLPGLTTRQRKAVIRRLRQEASRGFGPPLPPPQLAMALGLDRLRSAARIAAAIIRLHPAATLVPGAFVVAVMSLFVIASADGLGATFTAPSGLAEAAAGVGGGGAVQAAASGPGSTRAPRVTVGAGADGSGRGGTSGSGGPGRDSGQGAPAKRAPGKSPAHGKRHAVRWSVRPGTWHVCPHATTAQRPRSTAKGPRSRAGQLACRRSGSRWVPYTAHRPGPRDFAR
jgi:hypothetical protein